MILRAARVRVERRAEYVCASTIERRVFTCVHGETREHAHVRVYISIIHMTRKTDRKKSIVFHIKCTE